MTINDIKGSSVFTFFGTRFRIFMNSSSCEDAINFMEQDPRPSVSIENSWRLKNIKEFLKRENFFFGIPLNKERPQFGFFVEIEKDIFKVAPDYRSCKGCGKQFYVGLGSGLPVYLDINDRNLFSEHQHKLKRKPCPLCGQHFERDFIVLIIEKL